MKAESKLMILPDSTLRLTEQVQHLMLKDTSQSLHVTLDTVKSLLYLAGVIDPNEFVFLCDLLKD